MVEKCKERLQRIREKKRQKKETKTYIEREKWKNCENERKQAVRK